LIESGGSSKEFLKNWARLIQKIYNVNPFFVASLHAGLNLFNIKRPAKFGCRTTFISFSSEFFLSLRPDLNPYFLRTYGPNMRGLDFIWLTLGLAVGLS